MWIVAIVYFLHVVRKVVTMIKSKLQAQKQGDYVLEMVGILGDVATSFVLFFVAMQCIGLGMHISLLVMCLCEIFKNLTKRII